MKTFTKFCLILCGILFVLGFAGIGVSLAMGVRPSQLLDLANYPGKFNSQKLGVIEDIEDSIDRTVDSSIPDIPLLSGDNSEESDEYYEFDHAINNLDFELALCDLKIFFHDEDSVILKAWNTGNTFQCIQNEDTLHLEDNRNRLLFQDSMKDALYLKLYLPKQMLKKTNIAVGAGNITLDQLASEELDIQCGFGEMVIKDLTSEDIDIQVGVGNMDAYTITAAKSCTIESGTGNITLSKYDGSSLDLNCAVGDISVTAAGKPSQYDYDLECTAGEVHINHQLFESEHHHEEGHGPGCHVDIDNQADRKLHMQCGLGNMELNFTEED